MPHIKPISDLQNYGEVETLEELKLFYVRAALDQAREDISAGRVEDADVFFDDLQAGKYD